ncbi:TetR/AcrR family transcriptional regulator [Mesorhizobium sp. YIM 152430]|jgi:AcrR family transcriptional regulator|uniref:TetR/AcrR family transcriptional regulator n=1 Tax=Mesorhizobium sp. YIM 152430 TaxID=3031761 RepID=UPI0023D9EDF9|nr:TetR/AcrR family transcriptional regulator [Mesorhizobium sp. YIM 152430]MDF1601260.1 TetR/AcrR family transcriptional regulator [Mesorhizobium sp. YIM 152430]
MAGQAANERKRFAPDERRQMIVDEAAAFFSEVGLEGTTRELSQRLGVTQSLLYAYFASKADLLEAVFERVYLDRLSPDWPVLIADRSLPVRERAKRFYREYTGAIFTYEWMRIFMFSGLAGAELNRRYLGHLAKLMLEPLCAEMQRAAGAKGGPQMEDIWNLHGGIVYIGIRKFVYCVPTPDDFAPPVEAAVDRFCDSFGLE